MQVPAVLVAVRGCLRSRPGLITAPDDAEMSAAGPRGMQGASLLSLHPFEVSCMLLQQVRGARR